jgi:signal transduction histidine kinase
MRPMNASSDPTSDIVETGAVGPVPNHGGVGESGHFVQFYDDTTLLEATVARFIGDALEAGSSGLVIATKTRVVGIEEKLRRRGIDVTRAAARGQYVTHDAASTLAAFMRADRPDPQRFREVVGPIVTAAARQSRTAPRIFGEMVALLYADGKREAAVRLEELWNELAKSQPFSLLCAYPMGSFATSKHRNGFGNVCNVHARVIPADSYTTLVGADDRLREIASLQQKAAALEAEMAERRKMEARLDELLRAERRAREEAEAANRGKDQFLATLSHELRTPLTSILGWVRMLRAGNLDAERSAHAFAVIERSAHVQIHLIEDLLEVSRIIAGNLVLDFRTVDLADEIATTVEALRPTAEGKGLALALTLDPSVGVIVGDPHRCRQVISNVVSNAVKYTPQGGRIEVALVRVGHDIARIVVRDNGVGISASFLPRVFERYTQARQGAGDLNTGLGLGLSIARHLVELHGGSIRVESPGEGGGTTFTIDLPIAGDSTAARPIRELTPRPRTTRAA